MKGEVDKESIQRDQKINAEFNECFNKKWDEETSYKDFCKALMEAARETASRPIEVNKPWFDFNKEILVPMMEKRNRALHRTRENNLSEEELEARKDDLRRMQKGIYDQTRVAIERWALFDAKRISNMNFNPRVA